MVSQPCRAEGRRARRRKAYSVDLSVPLGFAVMKESYLEWMREKDYSPATVRSRDAYLHYFLEWCDERIFTRPNEITKPILERYQRYLYTYRKENGEPLTIRSQHARTFLLPSCCVPSPSGCVARITCSTIQPLSWSCRNWRSVCQNRSLAIKKPRRS